MNRFTSFKGIDPNDDKFHQTFIFFFAEIADSVHSSAANKDARTVLD